LDKFLTLKRAFETLTTPSLRAEYDALYQQHNAEPIEIFELKEFSIGVEGEANRRLGILCLLYTRRRSNPDDPGLSMLEFESMMSVPREHLMFTMWYLRSKKFIAVDDASAYTLTALGADYVEENAPANPLLEQLLRRRSTWAGSSTARNSTDRAAPRQPRHGIKGISKAKSITAPEARGTLGP
jgi:hypothetical protein